MSHDEAEAPVIDSQTSAIATRFRGFMPVIIDVETGGFNCATDALLEIAAVFVRFNASGDLEPSANHRYIVKPFEGSGSIPRLCKSRASIHSIRCGPRSKKAMRCARCSKRCAKR